MSDERERLASARSGMDDLWANHGCPEPSAVCDYRSASDALIAKLEARIVTLEKALRDGGRALADWGIEVITVLSGASADAVIERVKAVEKIVHGEFNRESAK